MGTRPTPKFWRNPPGVLLALLASTLCCQASNSQDQILEEKAQGMRLVLLQENRKKWDGGETPSQADRIRLASKPITTAPKDGFQLHESLTRQNIAMLQKGVVGAWAPRKRVLARVTAYWANGGNTDRWSAKNESSTGNRLICRHHVAVDPNVIPYGSKLIIQYNGGRIAVEAVDTGGDVKNRLAARKLGRTPQEKSAPVVDLFFQNREDAKEYTDTNPPFQWVDVIPPPNAYSQTLASRS